MIFASFFAAFSTILSAFFCRIIYGQPGLQIYFSEFGAFVRVFIIYTHFAYWIMVVSYIKLVGNIGSSHMHMEDGHICSQIG